MRASGLLTFGVGGDLFAVPLAAVGGVGLLGPLVVPPDAPACLRGITNRAGELLPVVDLQLLLGLERGSGATAEPPVPWLVVLRDGGRAAGLIAHREPNIVQVTEDEPLPEAPEPAGSPAAVHRYLTLGGNENAPQVALLDPAAVLRAATIQEPRDAPAAGVVA